MLQTIIDAHKDKEEEEKEQYKKAEIHSISDNDAYKATQIVLNQLEQQAKDYREAFSAVKAIMWKVQSKRNEGLHQVTLTEYFTKASTQKRPPGG